MRKLVLLAPSKVEGSKVEGTKKHSQKIFLAFIHVMIFVLGFFVFSLEAQAANWYVNSSCSIDGNGTASICATSSGGVGARKVLHDAINGSNVAPGDTIIAVDGIYSAYGSDNESVGFIRKWGTDENHRLTIKAQNKHQAVIDCGSKLESSGKVGFVLNNNVGYVTIEDFEITNCYLGVQPNNNNDYIIIKNNKIHNVLKGYSGGDESDYNVIDGNTVYDFGDQTTPWIAIYPRGKSTIIQNNLVYNNLGIGHSFQAGTYGTVKPSGTWKIVNNTFTDSIDSGLDVCMRFYNMEAAAIDMHNNICFGASNGLVNPLDTWQSDWTAKNNLIVDSATVCYDSGQGDCALCDGTRCSGNIFNTSAGFTNESINNYSLAGSSSVINKGLATHAPDHDILNATRPYPQGGAYDIGAFEYVSGPDKYYASPNGTGDGLSESSPFKVADFWPIAGAGDTLYLLNGIYKGTNSMITPPQGLNGTMENPITIKALNDGEVEFDGEKSRPVVRLYYNNYFIIEGFNAHDSYQSPSHVSVVDIAHSNNNILRRIVAWDTMEGNAGIFGISSSQNNLLEDVAGFGIARKIFSSSQNGDNTTIRRAWGSWDGCHFAGPKMTYTMAYNNYGMTCENCIGTFTGSLMKEAYKLLCDPGSTYSSCGTQFNNYSVDQSYAIFGTDGFKWGAHFDSDSKILGSIAYIQPEYRFNGIALFQITKMNEFEIKDSVAYIKPGSSNPLRIVSLDGDTSLANNNFIADFTSVGINESFREQHSYIYNKWIKSNIIEAESFNEIYSQNENIFNTENGANLCKRYKDRVLTNEPLWPWPMNQRIIDATTYAGREVVDVTATIEELFGTIPDECREGGFVSADVNGDGRVNIKDIQEVIRCIINLEGCEFPERSDVNKDGQVNIKDIQEIIRAIIN